MRFQQRLRQIAIYMRPIVEFDELLKQDAHEDGVSDPVAEQQTNDRRRKYSDSSMTSIDGEDEATIRNRKNQANKNRSQILRSTSSQPQPFYSDAGELYGAQLVNPLAVLTSSLITE